MTIAEQLEVIKESGIREDLIEALSRAAYFHGHICPGLAMGVLASMAFLGKNKPSEDEEIVAVVESKACGIDAVQVLTGCTFGKGNLVFLDHGKSVFTFYRRSENKGMRYALKNIMPILEKDGAGELFAKVRSGNASDEEKISFQKLWTARTITLLKMDIDIFRISDAIDDIPEKAQIYETLTCSSCKENLGAYWAVWVGDEALCIPCSKKSN